MIMLIYTILHPIYKKLVEARYNVYCHSTNPPTLPSGLQLETYLYQISSQNKFFSAMWHSAQKLIVYLYNDSIYVKLISIKLSR